MNRLTTLLLLVLVVGLGLAVWYQTEHEEPVVERVVVPLFEGLETGELTRIRVDNIERNIHLSLDRGEDGRWDLTDPLAYPARHDMVVQLLSILHENRAWIVAESEEEPLREALEQPRARLRLFTGEGPPDHELLMGAVDADAMRINVLADGQVRRTLRNLETVLETSVLDWRSRQVFDMRPDEVVEIRRAGIDPREDRALNLDLHARRDGAGWWLDRPVRLNASPSYMRIWSAALTQLRVDRFHSDVPDPDLEAFGLAPPAFTLTLMDRRGSEQTLEVGKPVVSAPTYFARRSGSRHVWELEPQNFSQVFHQPDQLFDPVLVRLPREYMDQILLRGAGHEVRLTRVEAEEEWTVASRPTEQEDAEWSVERPAEERRVGEVLALLGKPDVISAYLWHEPVEDYFPPGSPVEGLWAVSGGIRHGGRVGEEYVTEGGVHRHTFLRERESAVCLVPPEVGALLERPPQDYVSLQLTALSEPILQNLYIGHGDVRREFRRTIQGTWVHPELDSDALPELLPVIEHLFFLTAERHLAPEEEVPLEDVVTVRIEDRRGQTTYFEVGRTAGGEVHARIEGRQAVLKHQALHEDLLEIAR